MGTRLSKSRRLADVGLTRLMVHAIADSSFNQYKGPLRAFLYDAKTNGYRLDTPEEIDWCLARFLDDLCYLENADFGKASKTYSGLTHLVPELRDNLPRAARALNSWQRLANPAEGGPVPQAALGLIIKHFLEVGDFTSAYVVLLSYDGVLRESDWESLTAQDVSVVAAGTAPPQVALLLGSGARGLATKTGSDQGVVLDDAFLRAWTAGIREITAATAALVPMAQVEFRRKWWQALAALGLEAMGPPHSLRHSRPSHDVLSGAMSLEEARRRGRWLSLKSVQRYTKGHALVAKKCKLTPEQLKQGADIWDDLPKMVVTLSEQGCLPHGSVQAAIVLKAAQWALKPKGGGGKIEPETRPAQGRRSAKRD